MAPQKFKLLCLGDSYTIGEAVAPEERFAHQAVNMLKTEDIAFEQPLIIARTGWTTDELSTAIREAGLKETFDFVTLLIGVNNQYRNRDTDNYRKEFTALLQVALEFAGEDRNRVCVLSIPDWGVTPFAAGDKRSRGQIAAEIDAYNEVNKEVASRFSVHYLDITPVSRRAASDDSLNASDGLHPSGKMYREWAEPLSRIIRDALSGARD